MKVSLIVMIVVCVSVVVCGDVMVIDGVVRSNYSVVQPSSPRILFEPRNKICDKSKCDKENPGSEFMCCGETFDCLNRDSESSCVYNNTIKPEENICISQSSSCYYCCFSKTCNNRKACENHYKDVEDNIILIFIIHSCLFLVAIIAFIILVALRKIRLNRVKELKLNHKYLTNNTYNNNSNTDSRRDSRDLAIGNNDIQESFTLTPGEGRVTVN